MTFPDSGGAHLVRLESRDESRVESRERLVQRAGEGEGKRGERGRDGELERREWREGV